MKTKKEKTRDYFLWKRLRSWGGAKDVHDEALYSSTLRYEGHVTLEAFRFGRVWWKLVREKERSLGESLL